MNYPEKPITIPQPTRKPERRKPARERTRPLTYEQKQMIIDELGLSEWEAFHITYELETEEDK